MSVTSVGYHFMITLISDIWYAAMMISFVSQASEQTKHSVQNKLQISDFFLSQSSVGSQSGQVFPRSIKDWKDSTIAGRLHPWLCIVRVVWVMELEVVKLLSMVEFWLETKRLKLTREEWEWSNWRTSFPFIAGWGSRRKILTRIPIKYFLQLSYEKTGSVRSAGIRKTRAGLPFFRLEPASSARADDLTTGRLRSQQLEVFFFHSSSSLSPALQLYKLVFSLHALLLVLSSAREKLYLPI